MRFFQLILMNEELVYTCTDKIKKYWFPMELRVMLPVVHLYGTIIPLALNSFFSWTIFTCQYSKAYLRFHCKVLNI